MSSDDQLRRENEALRMRTSRLSAAILRISTSLDLNTVLQEVMASACSLSAARYGVIITIDEAGEIQDFVTSGIPAEAYRQLEDWTDGARLYGHLRDHAEPLNLVDFPAYLRSLDLSPCPLSAKAFLATPMLHRGTQVGSFFLGGKDGASEFSSEDEEILMLFASQATMAIANARAYRDEQRARANLEALVSTSPVGVVVFDASTGKPVSVNQEAKRIVEGLRTPGHSPEQLIEVITCHRADGRTIAMDEFVVIGELNTNEIVRAEEVVLSVEDGRCIRTLINATPILSEEGAVDSVVVTMQDLEPLEKLERLRAEFLGMVSHELRAPLTSIKGSTATVLDAQPILDAAEMQQFFRIIDEQADQMRTLISDLLDAGRIETGTLSVTPRPVKLADLIDQARNTFLSGGGRHTILIDIPLELPLVMADRRRIVQILGNLFSNASRHSPESAPIRVVAVHDGVHVAVTVSDEGQGIPLDQLAHLFSKYPSITGGDREPGIRGGLGLAICKGLVEAHGGRIWAESGGIGQGTRFTFTIPVADTPDGTAVSGAPGDPPSQPLKVDGRTRILVVDDDPQTLRFVRDALSAANYSPLVTGEHRELSHIIRTEKPHLVLLDLILPGTNGIELMERVPELGDQPVIFISAYGRDETIARALEIGAADYIVKPFSATELTARIQAALRKRVKAEPFVLGDLAIHYEPRQVTVAARAVQLTATEFELLRVLSVNAGRVVTYESLLRQVWGDRQHASMELVRSFMKRLRRKLGDKPTNPSYIFNVRGVGYRMPRPGDP